MIDGRGPSQVGIVVPDLEAALERYDVLWGGGAWRCFTYGAGRIPDVRYRGEPGTYSMQFAINQLTPQIELIQPLEGPSIYHEFLERGGQGLHHLGFWVDSIEEAVSSMAQAGYDCTQAGFGYGLDGDGGYAYFETERDFGVILEAIEVPKRRPEPDFTWPK
jgi:methylmalonyl-CoA/ethylmalonyl-CoA epimerase